MNNYTERSELADRVNCTLRIAWKALHCIIRVLK